MTAPRSQSVPASRNLGNATLDTEEESIAFPSLTQELASEQRVPSWIQELANARSGRHSRASSVVSTRTRFSTTTFDDARSVDIQAGGQTFRISRFGDRITDTSAPPPYPGPHEDGTFAHRVDTIHVGDAGVELERSRHHGPRHGPHHRGAGVRRHARRVRIAMPDHEGTISTNDDDSFSADTPSRELTDEELRQIILDLPSRLKAVLGINPERLELDNISLSEANDLSATRLRHDTPHELHLAARHHHSESTHDNGFAGSGQVRGILRNAPDHAPYHMDAALLDRGESRWTPNEEANVPRVRGSRNDVTSPRSLVPDTEGDEGNEYHHDSPERLLPRTGHAREEGVVPPTVDDLNELSQVYNKVIRDLDREHRKQLHNRDKELDQLRVLLHEKDIVYRQQLKGKDFVIDDLKQRLDRFEESMELRIERARYEVEELWEERWREHQTQLMEKCGLVKPAMQNYSSSATQSEE